MSKKNRVERDIELYKTEGKVEVSHSEDMIINLIGEDYTVLQLVGENQGMVILRGTLNKLRRIVLNRAMIKHLKIEIVSDTIKLFESYRSFIGKISTDKHIEFISMVVDKTHYLSELLEDVTVTHLREVYVRNVTFAEDKVIKFPALTHCSIRYNDSVTINHAPITSDFIYALSLTSTKTLNVSALDNFSGMLDLGGKEVIVRDLTEDSLITLNIKAKEVRCALDTPQRYLKGLTIESTHVELIADIDDNDIQSLRVYGETGWVNFHGRPQSLKRLTIRGSDLILSIDNALSNIEDVYLSCRMKNDTLKLALFDTAIDFTFITKYATDIEPVASMPRLNHVYIHCSGIKHFDLIQKADTLETLKLCGCDLQEITIPKGSSSLTRFDYDSGKIHTIHQETPRFVFSD